MLGTHGLLQIPQVVEALAPGGHTVIDLKGSPAGEGLHSPMPLPAAWAFLLQDHSRV